MPQPDYKIGSRVDLAFDASMRGVVLGNTRTTASVQFPNETKDCCKHHLWQCVEPGDRVTYIGDAQNRIPAGTNGIVRSTTDTHATVECEGTGSAEWHRANLRLSYSANDVIVKVKPVSGMKATHPLRAVMSSLDIDATLEWTWYSRYRTVDDVVAELKAAWDEAVRAFSDVRFELFWGGGRAIGGGKTLQDISALSSVYEFSYRATVVEAPRGGDGASGAASLAAPTTAPVADAPATVATTADVESGGEDETRPSPDPDAQPAEAPIGAPLLVENPTSVQDQEQLTEARQALSVTEEEEDDAAAMRGAAGSNDRGGRDGKRKAAEAAAADAKEKKKTRRTTTTEVPHPPPARMAPTAPPVPRTALSIHTPMTTSDLAAVRGRPGPTG